MNNVIQHCKSWAGPLALTLLLVACAAPTPQPEAPAPKPQAPSCQAAATDDALIGNWLNIRTQRGVVGELRSLFTLNADGTMAYNELLKRSKQPSQGLAETGCWHREGQTLVLRTLQSNGADVDADDPIYVNRYTVTSTQKDRLSLLREDGINMPVRRMSPGYRLPF
jgi:hypothetical protein